MVTAIVAAMPEEMAPLRAEATDVRLAGGRAAPIVLGRLHGTPVALIVTGDGERRAREGIAALFSAVPVGRLIAIGVAGALSPGLGEGALVVGERVVSGAGADFHADFRADAALVDWAAAATGARRAVIVTSDRIADTVAEKRRLLSAAPAGALAAVVDLESASYAAAAVRAAVPWIVLRAVSDTADEALPALLNRSRDAGGAVRRGSVLRGLLGDPGALPTLLSLRRRVQRCAGVLAEATRALLVHLVPVVAGAPGSAFPAAAAREGEA